MDTTPQGDNNTNMKSDNQLKLAPPVSIVTDVAKLRNFLNFVFDTHTPEEKILTWRVSAGRQPAFPEDSQTALDRLSVAPAGAAARALYFSTATAYPDPQDGRLFNRKNLFGKLYVVVLDDVGTKVPLEKLEGIEPSYIIESSEGNYQYGYVLEKPIDDLTAAEFLIQTIYDAGFSDGGGKMPNKLVRLPDGVNGKLTEGKRNFHVNLKQEPTVVWDVQDLLDAMEIGINWEEAVADIGATVTRYARSGKNTSAWATTNPVAPNLDGVIDPVLEVLYENNQVLTDNGGEWVQVHCPWGHSHTTGDQSAGYAPIGRGTSPNTRGFNCFHEHCAAYHTEDFLSHVAESYGVEAPVHDEAAGLVAEWVYDAFADSAVSLKSNLKYPMKVFNNVFQRFKSTVYLRDGKKKQIQHTTLWANSPSRVVVNGSHALPTSTNRIAETPDGIIAFNEFIAPIFPDLPINMAHVDKFNDFLQYLIPDGADREYFTEWLACKVQDKSFRGAGIIMYTTTQGIGRSTLAGMVRTLMGEKNCVAVGIKDMLESNFSVWPSKVMVTCDEFMMPRATDNYGNYEKLKEIIDPSPSSVWINNKYQTPYQSVTYSSFLLLSNHADCVSTVGGDRRLYVMENNKVRRSGEFFTDLRKWIAEGEWATHVNNWLLSYDADPSKMAQPAPMTATKLQMSEETASYADEVLGAVVTALDTPYVSNTLLMAALAHVPARVMEGSRLDEIKILRRKLRSMSTPLRVIKIEGKSERYRVLNSAFTDTGKSAFPYADVKNLTPDEVSEMSAVARDALEDVISGGFADRLRAELELEGLV